MFAIPTAHLKRAPIALLVMASILVSCSPAVQKNITSDYEQVVEPQDVDVFEPDMPLPQEAEQIGSIEISDTGFTTDCSLTKVVNLARTEASKQGGHAIKITNVNEPDLASTCFRIDADVYRYPIFNASEDTERLDVTEEEINNYLEENKDNLAPIEGVWTFSVSVESKIFDETVKNENVYDIAIVKDNFENNREFNILIISSENKRWNRVGLVKGKIEPTAYGNIYDVTWLKSNGTRVTTNFNLEERGLITGEFDTRLYTSSARLIKKYPSITEGDDNNEQSKISRGTGFVISKNGLLVTNEHVVSNSKSIKLKFRREDGVTKTYYANKIISDEKSDISVLKIEDEGFGGFKSIPYGVTKRYVSGQNVFTLGYPMTGVMGESVKVTEGIISSTKGPTEKDIFMQTSVPIQPGNSGGPLFDMSGNIVGITTATLSERATGVDAENVNYSIKSEHFVSLASVLSDYSSEDLSPNTQETKLSAMVKRYSPYICIVEAKVE